MPEIKKFFDDCVKTSVSPAPAELVVLESKNALDQVVPDLAATIGEHYVTERILRKWGRNKLADYLAKKIPTAKMGKSGDMGEILATEYIGIGILNYQVPVKRLRWKDSRELPMRGEDVIGFRFGAVPLQFLKSEAKSREKLTEGAVTLARGALEKNAGLPLAHSLSFIVDRLYEANDDDKAAAIEEYVTSKVPDRSQVAHLLFTFSGNDPTDLLRNDLKLVKRGINHFSVGLYRADHQTLIQSVYEEACDGGNC